MPHHKYTDYFAYGSNINLRYLLDHLAGLGVGADEIQNTSHAAVHLDTSELAQAWVYEFGDPDMIANRPPLIVDHHEGTSVFS